MSEDSSRNKSTLITAAGILLFLAAGIFTMLFFPSEEQKLLDTVSKSEKSEKIFLSPDVEQAAEKNENVPEVKKPKSDWYVYVTGEVKNPGYYKISPDSRIFQAVEAAGGFTKKADIASVNMASPLTDGFQVDVKAKSKNKIAAPSNTNVRIPGVIQRPAAPIAFKTPEARATTSDGRVDINAANADELTKLKGVGPAIAKKIVEYRKSHGKFSKPDDLLNVKGIGKAKLEKMRSQILIR